MTAVSSPSHLTAAAPTTADDPVVSAAVHALLDPPTVVHPLPSADDPLPSSCETGAWYRLLLHGDQRVSDALADDDLDVIPCVQRAIRSADVHRLVRDLHALTPYAFANQRVLQTLADRVAEVDRRLAHGLIRRGTPLAAFP